MPNVRDILSRFRPAGAPGASRAAVPVDRRRQLESELSPVLVLLDGPSAECAGVIAAAERDAEHIVGAARGEAARIVSDARQRAAARAAELVQEAMAAARTQASAITAAGAAEAAAIAERAGLRLPALADRAVASVRDLGRSGGVTRAEPPGAADQPGQAR